jgi:O-antigen biosynthesis protein
MAPPGSYREALGRKATQGMLGVRRRLRVAWQRVLRTANVSLPASFAADIATELRRSNTRSHDVLCLPIIDWRFRFQRPQQLMRQYAQHGHRVFYVSQDFLLAAPLAVERIENNVYGLKLPADAGRKAFEEPLSETDVQGMADGVLQLLAEGMIDKAVLVVQHPFWAELAEQLRERFDWPIVYDCMDDHAGLRRQTGWMLDLERRLVQMADLTVATSDRLAEKVAPQSHRVALVRNGVDYEHFAETRPAPLAGEDIIVGYYGAISHWFDGRLVADLALLHPDWRFELVGNTFNSDLRPLYRLPNVSLLGEKPYADIPRQMAHWHCCIIPFLRNELTEATNPVKVYEMLAAGMPVVAVDLPELRPIAEANLIELADDAAGFAEKIAKLLAAQTPAVSAARRQFASRNTWEERFREMSAAVAPLALAPCALAKRVEILRAG